MAETNLKRRIGFDSEKGQSVPVSPNIVERIDLNLLALGQPIFGEKESYPALTISDNLLAHFRAKNALVKEGLRPPVDLRIEAFLRDYLADLGEEGEIHLPGNTFNLSQHGVARALSLPADGDKFEAEIVEP